MSAKMQFVMDYNAVSLGISIMIIVLRLPSGALEVIQNTQNLETKYLYYLETYDENMVMYKNPDIKILKWIMV